MHAIKESSSISCKFNLKYFNLDFHLIKHSHCWIWKTFQVLYMALWHYERANNMVISFSKDPIIQCVHMHVTVCMYIMWSKKD